MTNISWKNITLAHAVVSCGPYFVATLDGETCVVTASAADWPTAKKRLEAIAVRRVETRETVTRDVSR